MATTTRKGSENKKAKPRRPMVNTLVAEQAQTIAELRQELEARNRDLAESLQREKATASENVRLLNELKESLEQQTATSEILRVMSSSPTDLQPVFETILANATRLCGTRNAGLYRFDGELLHFAAGHNLPPDMIARQQSNPFRSGRES